MTTTRRFFIPRPFRAAGSVRVPGGVVVAGTADERFYARLDVRGDGRLSLVPGEYVVEVNADTPVTFPEGWTEPAPAIEPNDTDADDWRDRVTNPRDALLHTAIDQAAAAVKASGGAALVADQAAQVQRAADSIWMLQLDAEDAQAHLADALAACVNALALADRYIEGTAQYAAVTARFPRVTQQLVAYAESRAIAQSAIETVVAEAVKGLATVTEAS